VHRAASGTFPEKICCGRCLLCRLAGVGSPRRCRGVGAERTELGLAVPVANWISQVTTRLKVRAQPSPG
jgi:hypothetical protein